MLEWLQLILRGWVFVKVPKTVMELYYYYHYYYKETILCTNIKVIPFPETTLIILSGFGISIVYVSAKLAMSQQ